MRKKYFLPLLLLCTAVVLNFSGCTKKNTFIFAYQDRIGDAASILAADELQRTNGFELRRFSSGSLCAEALISGTAHAATMGDAVAVMLAARYPDTVVLLAVHGGGPDRHRLVSEIKEPKTIAVKFGTSTHGALLEWLQENGMNARLIDMSPDMQLAALAAGEVDALAASEPTPSVAEQKTGAAVSIPLELEGRTYPLVLVTTRKALETYSDQIIKLEETIRTAGEKLKRKTYSDKERKLLSDVTGLDGAVLIKSLERHRFGYFPTADSLSELQGLASFLTEQGTIPEIPDWERVLSNPR